MYSMHVDIKLAYDVLFIIKLIILQMINEQVHEILVLIHVIAYTQKLAINAHAVMVEI